MREAGWYWVKWTPDCDWDVTRFDGSDWLFNSFAQFNSPKIIGPKINEPEELG